jgi:hypothetical protein
MEVLWEKREAARIPEPIAVTPSADLPVSLEQKETPFRSEESESVVPDAPDIGFADVLHSGEEFAMAPQNNPPVKATEMAAQAESPPISVDQDRVDELLRQFRERYGK